MEDSINIVDIMQIIKKRLKLVIIMPLFMAIIVGAISAILIKPTYEASTKLFIGKDDASSEKYSQSDIMMYQTLMKTYSEAIKTKDLMKKAVESKDYNIDVDGALDSLTVNTMPNTQILQIKFKNTEPTMAANIIEAVTDEFMKLSKELVPNGNTKVIEKVEVPTNPVSPNIKLNMIIAFFLGIIISFGIAFLMDFLDNTYKTKESIENELNIPVVGNISIHNQ
ncbi:Capsular polysaccharide biosynthesis protein [Hathewaya proteolytica DSM 3090]|uniref:Capsular polysaccharide biosynthesis protein n=1 Tax=Hathewaya proteolytica DSM 3090 TaxID=1121331 RepID=A0A1M6Q340_9CLOT|nr:Wzz/FepE/Etk N-terminal domain-containing protein [Hathewaya proteolytica]SHK14644.1 Capsular polysaccharide biosynthesis protein [Hathewaya proteolytica DSM 3090]